MTEYLKSNVEKLIELDKQEDKYKNIISELKKEKDAVNNNIINFMEKNNITNKDIILGDTKIKYAQTKVAENITKKRIYERLTTYFGDEKSAKQATDFIYSERESKINKSIKILNIK